MKLIDTKHVKVTIAKTKPRVSDILIMTAIGAIVAALFIE